MAKINYLGFIDGLRGISVALVFLFHLIPEKFSGGFLGVDIFFVISGFVISKSLFEEKKKTGKFQLIKFYIRRFKRIFPVLFFVIIFCTIFYFKFGHLTQNQRVVESSLTALFGISNLYFLRENNDYFLGNTINPLGHTWSLGIEEQFYLFYPSLLLFFYFLRNNFKNFFKEAPITFLFLLLIISLYLFIFSKNNLLGNFYSPFARSWQLMLGVLVYISLFSEDKFLDKLLLKSAYFSNIIALISLVIIIILSLFYFNENDFRIGSIVISFLTIIIIFCLAEKNNSILLNNKILIFFGKISYSIYLWHFPIIYFSELYFEGINFYFFVILFTILLSLFSHTYIENPLRKSSLFLNLDKKKNIYDNIYIFFSFYNFYFF